MLELRDLENVLDAAVRAGLHVDYSCRNGTCLTCIHQAVAGSIPSRAQKGVKATLCEQGYFLPCVCVPTGNLIVVSDSEHHYRFATVISVKRLATTVCQVILEPEKSFRYHAGQFINLRRYDCVTRSYSLASSPSRGSPYLELHVKLLDGGRMSGWIFNTLKAGDTIKFQCPNGSCFYVPTQGYRPMILIGTGTGLAPLLGIVRDVLSDPNYDGDIHLYHGSRHMEGIYMNSYLRALARKHRNFRYVPCLSGEERHPEAVKGRAEDVAFDDHPNLNGWRVFLCGHPAMVRAAHRTAYLQGAEMLDIHADPFETQQ